MLPFVDVTNPAGRTCYYFAMNEIARILNVIQQGEPNAAADQLLPLVYEELRNLAAARLANEKPG